MKSFGELEKEQTQRESSFLSQLMGETTMEGLVQTEADLTERRNQALFSIAAEIEDTEAALNQAEQLVQRVKEHLEQLKGLQRVLSKQERGKR